MRVFVTAVEEPKGLAKLIHVKASGHPIVDADALAECVAVLRTAHAKRTDSGEPLTELDPKVEEYVKSDPSKRLFVAELKKPRDRVFPMLDLTKDEMCDVRANLLTDAYFILHRQPETKRKEMESDTGQP